MLPRTRVPETTSRVTGATFRAADRRARRPRWVLGLGLILGLALGAAFGWELVQRQAAQRRAAQGRDARRSPSQRTEPRAQQIVVPKAAGMGDGQGDANAMWQSPTAGAAIDPTHLPAGSQLILAWRPAAMLACPEGPRVWQALGPWREYFEGALSRECGATAAEIAELRVALREGDNGSLLATYVVRTVEPRSPREWLERWGSPEDIPGVPRAWQRAGRAWWFPIADDPTQLVVTPAADLAALVEQGTDPPLLRRELEELLASSDADRHLTIVMAPGFLERGGRTALLGEAVHALDDLRWLWGDDVTAASLSAHIDERFFCELRTIGRSGSRPSEALRRLQTRVKEIPSRIAERAQYVDTTPASRSLLDRLPPILDFAARQTRAAVEGDQVVVRMYLPDLAAHHLALAGQVILVDRVSESNATLVSEESRHSESKFDKRVSLRFSKTTLEAALAELSDQIGVPITIDGPALQREGITKNQSFGVDISDVPAEEALRTLLALANPDGKLVHVLDDGDTKPRLRVTTQAAAASTAKPTEKPTTAQATE